MEQVGLAASLGLGTAVAGSGEAGEWRPAIPEASSHRCGGLFCHWSQLLVAFAVLFVSVLPSPLRFPQAPRTQWHRQVSCVSCNFLMNIL